MNFTNIAFILLIAVVVLFAGSIEAGKGTDRMTRIGHGIVSINYYPKTFLIEYLFFIL